MGNPEEKFDPEGLLDEISLLDIVSNSDKVISNPKAQAFLNNFIGDGYKYNNEYFSSSEPYKVSIIEPDRYIQLTKNTGWWGNKLSLNNEHIHANLSTITYYSIPETINALHSLKQGDIDIMDNIPANEYIQLMSDNEFKKGFNLFSPLNFRFTFIGFNSRKGMLGNKKLRQAIAHSLNKKDIVNNVAKGYAQTTIAPLIQGYPTITTMKLIRL